MATSTSTPELEQRGINVIRGLADGRGPEGELRPPGHADGARAARARAVHADHELRRRATRLARPRPLRALERARVDAALLDALPHRLRARRSTTSSSSASGARRPPGHPEYGHAAGIEVTTGPLGQGIANAVGLALAEANLRARFGAEVTDHHVFAICGDGDLEEGVSHEAASLAGHLGLGRLVVVYDDNHITIDGPTELALHRRRPGALRGATAGTSSSSVRSRTTSTRSSAALREAHGRADRPSLVVLRSHIGWPSPKYTDTAKAHGSPLGERRGRARSRRSSACRPTSTSAVPDDVLAFYRAAGARGRAGARGVGAAPCRAAATRSRSSPTSYDACLDGTRARAAGRRSSRRGRRASRSRPARRAPRSLDAIARRRARARRRRRRPHRQHRHGAQGRAGDRHPPASAAARSTSASASTAWASIMNGMAVERPAAVRRHVLRVQRLHARRGAPRRALGLQGRVRLVARLDRPRRGRPDPPADRAARGAAGDARAPGDPARRRQRDRAGVAGPHRRRRARPRSSSPARSVPVLDGHGRARARRRRRGRVRARRRGRRRPRPRAHRHRLRGAAVRRRARRARRPGLSVRVVSMPCWELFAAQPDDEQAAGAAARRPDARGRGRARPSAGSATPTTPSASTTSARRRPARRGMRRVRLHRRERRRARARAARARERRHDDDQRRSPGSTTSGRAPGTTTSPARCVRGGGLAAAGRRRRDPRRHVEPDDPRQGASPPARATTSSSPSCAGSGLSTEDTLLGARARRHRRRRRPAAPGLRRARRRRRLRLGRGVADARARHRRRRSSRPRALLRAARPARTS